MAMTKAEENKMFKLEKDIEFWKTQAGLVENKKSKVKWSNYSEEMYLPEIGCVSFDFKGRQIEVTLLEDGIKLYYRGGPEDMCIFPDCSNVITVKAIKKE